MPETSTSSKSPQPSASLGFDTLWRTFPPPRVLRMPERPAGPSRDTRSASSGRPPAAPLPFHPRQRPTVVDAPALAPASTVPSLAPVPVPTLPPGDTPEASVPPSAAPATPPVAAAAPGVTTPDVSHDWPELRDTFRPAASMGESLFTAPRPVVAPSPSPWPKWVSRAVAVLGFVCAGVVVSVMLRDPAPSPVSTIPAARVPEGHDTTTPLVRLRPEAWHLPDEALLGFVEVPAGAAVIGVDRVVEPWADHNETPPSRIEVPPFLIGRYEVTTAQFEACVHAGGCEPSENAASLSRATPTEPVRGISWFEAMAYCRWIEARLREWPDTPQPIAARLSGSLDGRTWHVVLPSEVEWERAVRGSDPTATGNIVSAVTANTHATGLGTAARVGSFPTDRGAEGLLDAGGNVSEWTRSLYKPYPYDATDGREDEEATGVRIARGGSFLRGPWFARPTARHVFSPGLRLPDLGFRLAMSARSTPATAAQGFERRGFGLVAADPAGRHTHVPQ